jgi:lipopolysaccharide export system permease protein
MRDLLIADSRNPQAVSTYIAKKGYFAEMEGTPAIVMTDGHVEQLNNKGVLELGKFSQATFDLAPFVSDQKSVILKESDRYLPELFYPDMTNFYDNANRKRLLAEGHARIAAPLLNIAMALIAIYAVLGGDFSRRGYTLRIGLATAAALSLRLAAFGAVAAGNDDPKLNVLQYALPVGATLVVGILHFMRPARGRRTVKIRPRRGGPQQPMGSMAGGAR